MSTATNNGLPKDLLADYQESCHVQGETLENFFELAREKWDASALIALLERAELDIQENIAMLLQANPDIEALAVANASRQHDRIEALREEIQ